MKTILSLLALCMLFSCNSPAEKPADLSAPVSETDPLQKNLYGKWQVDSTGFINDHVPTKMEAPLADAFWEFTPEGQLKISGNIAASSEFCVRDSSFHANLMGLDMVYQIKLLSADKLVLASTITDTKEMKMETVTLFKRVK